MAVRSAAHGTTVSRKASDADQQIPPATYTAAAMAASTLAVGSSRITARPANPANVTGIAVTIQTWIQVQRRWSRWMIGSDSSSGRW